MHRKKQFVSFLLFACSSSGHAERPLRTPPSVGFQEDPTYVWDDKYERVAAAWAKVPLSVYNKALEEVGPANGGVVCKSVSSSYDSASFIAKRIAQFKNTLLEHKADEVPRDIDDSTIDEELDRTPDLPELPDIDKTGMVSDAQSKKWLSEHKADEVPHDLGDSISDDERDHTPDGLERPDSDKADVISELDETINDLVRHRLGWAEACTTNVGTRQYDEAMSEGLQALDAVEGNFLRGIMDGSTKGQDAVGVVLSWLDPLVSEVKGVLFPRARDPGFQVVWDEALADDIKRGVVKHMLDWVRTNELNKHDQGWWHRMFHGSESKDVPLAEQLSEALQKQLPPVQS